MIKTRKFKCEGCGKTRPCYVESNQDEHEFEYLTISGLKCVLDETNATGYEWKEVTND